MSFGSLPYQPVTRPGKTTNADIGLSLLSYFPLNRARKEFQSRDNVIRSSNRALSSCTGECQVVLPSFVVVPRVTSRLGHGKPMRLDVPNKSTCDLKLTRKSSMKMDGNTRPSERLRAK